MIRKIVGESMKNGVSSGEIGRRTARPSANLPLQALALNKHGDQKRENNLRKRRKMAEKGKGFTKSGMTIVQVQSSQAQPEVWLGKSVGCLG